MVVAERTISIHIEYCRNGCLMKIALITLHVATNSIHNDLEIEAKMCIQKENCRMYVFGCNVWSRFQSGRQCLNVITRSEKRLIFQCECLFI